MAQCKDCYGTPFLGIYSNGISKDKAKKLQFKNRDGSYVTGIIRNTSAEKAGLQPFDYIYGIDEYRTDFDRSLTDILRKYDPGDMVTLHFYRNGKPQTLKMRLGKRSDAEYEERSKKEDPFLGVEQARRNWDDDQIGIRVNIVRNSTAESMGLEDGDLITHINRFPIVDWTDLGTAIDMCEVGSTMSIDYVRDGKKQQTSGKVKSYYESKYGDYASFDTDNRTTRVSKTSVWEKDEAGWNERKISTTNLSDLSVSVLPATLSDLSTIGVTVSNKTNLTVNNLAMNIVSDKGLMKITFDLPSRGNTLINMYNQNGRKNYTYELDDFSGEFEDTMPITSGSDSEFYLVIRQNGLAKIQRVLLK